ncbi:iron-siderophore ABC transporter substrate-binding protein [Salipiger sp. IMCC34102]|uniref:ABC transporter substrate-binding protein n=1 Tax=Salipiger sp. IMCC34102 TaxID=2510647 RepID=UPI00101CD979|nr:ABC transporter substrate-binding protein [Salipiger sp. IMCC34102]RYH01683.1 iron-siderophore ABC transporter substrate-binding protein [Salipiger sp. IMCC34102]
MKPTTRTLATALGGLLAALPAAAQDFPLTLENKFGTTVIEEAPERVASLDFNGADNLLALGVQPVAIRYWYGDYENAVWPWADDRLKTTPAILRGDLNFEQIAAAEPDVIIALWSGITEQEYERLSLIAPVVAVPEGVGDYSLPWDELALIAGEAVGRLDEAEAQVAEIEAEMAAISDRNPGWEGKTASVAYYWNDNPGVYTGADIRPLLLSNLGLSTPDAVDALVGDNQFAVTFSEEELDIIDADVLVWVTDGSDGQRSRIEELALRPALTAHREGREIFTDALLTGAFSHGSLLSIPYALGELEPRIAAAIDGDPATEVPD